MKISSLDKALQIIEILCKNPQGLTLQELNQELGFPKSTIHHILSTFLPYDYITKDPDRKMYSLGFRFLGVSRTILDNIDIRRSAQDYIRKLQKECNETVHLYILRNGMVTCIDMVQKEVGGLSLVSYIGHATDPHAGAGGKVLLSGLSDREVKELYKNRILKIYGKNTITKMSNLLEELNSIRIQGYAIDNEEYYEGIRCVAAPIRAGGKIVAALSITGSIFAITMERIQREIIPFVKKTAEDISSNLKW